MSDDQFPPPRWRRNATGETSRDAALHMRPVAPRLRDRVLAYVEQRPGNPEDIHQRLKADGVFHLVSSIRPRFTELKAAGLVCDSGERGPGESRCRKSVIWRATTAEERSRFAALKALNGDDA